MAENCGVSSVHPIASKVGTYILKRGGNAIDAAIAMQLVLAVVHPSAGNLGGGGFMTVRFKDGRTLVLDFRETAPALARSDMFTKKIREDISAKKLAHLSSGVPGTVAGIFESLRYAKLSIKELFQPAIELAEKGYSYHVDLVKTRTEINTAPNVFDGTIKRKEGDAIKQQDLAATLKRIRDRGGKEFYEGMTAKLIVGEMQRGGGIMTLQDLKNYRAIWRKPHSFSYRGYDFASVPLPSAGGIMLHQMLKMMEPYPVSDYGYGSTAAINLMAEVERRAYRDRAEYLGDGDFSDVPVEMLTDEKHIKALMKDYFPGKASISKTLDIVPLNESNETTHFSIIDNEGNAVAVTTTLNGPYGSGVMVGGAGFFLNNEMYDFYTRPRVGNYPSGGGAANKIEPGKRMLSSMTPTIVSKDNKVFMVVGTPGGTTIPVSVFQAIVNVIDFKMSASDAISRAKFHHKWMPDELDGIFPQDTVKLLQGMGYKLTGKKTISFLEMIKVVRPRLIEIASERGSAEGN
ncbi:MAG: gamma-glutamyltransferase [Sediminibacterium sp.]